MKKIIFYLKIAFLLSFLTPINAQTSQIVFADTVGNSQTKSVDIGNLAGSDSVHIAIGCKGEIDLDSLGVYFVSKDEIRYMGTKTTVEYESSVSATYSKALTVNLDSAVVSYTAKVISIPKSAWAGYDYIRLDLVSAASGNDPTDPGQKAVIKVIKF